jgi:replication factor C subunit 3/5
MLLVGRATQRPVSVQLFDAAGDFPHMLLYGPPGAGKKTLMKALLHQIYGPGAEKVKVETKPWKIELPTRNLELELMTLSSNYHVEMNPSDVGNNDRYASPMAIKLCLLKQACE